MSQEFKFLNGYIQRETTEILGAVNNYLQHTPLF